MPNPKRRHSHQRTAKRRTNYVSYLPEVDATKGQGGEPFKLRHFATPEGFYKGRRLPGFKDKS
ncbi:MAG: 50S ribosomal protein L32 [Fimbriimonadaceae bacterium]|nr:50S ribosomal protein L32 [Fimbriimonadaceae bacterium]